MRLSSAFVLAALSVAPRGSDRRVAAATIAPLADLVRRVAGPGWDVVTVVPPGVSPHVFEPTPRDVRKIAPAELVVTVGAGYDDWAVRLVSACASRATIHDAGRSVGIVAEGGGHGHAHEDLAHEPHWWLSPALAGRALGPIANQLSLIDPGGAAGYRERAAATAASLERLDAAVAKMLAPARGRPFVAAHDAWGHFSARYGLQPLGAIEPVPGREPSPRELSALITSARRARLRVIFTEPQFPVSAARVVAGEAGIDVATVDPIGGMPGRETYESLLRYDAAVFRRWLGLHGAPGRAR